MKQEEKCLKHLKDKFLGTKASIFQKRRRESLLKLIKDTNYQKKQKEKTLKHTKENITQMRRREKYQKLRENDTANEIEKNKACNIKTAGFLFCLFQAKKI